MPAAERKAALHVVESVRATFPVEGARVDAILLQEGYDYAPNIWLERFSQFTTDAIKQGNVALAAEHFTLFSALVAGADEATTRCIDVAYVESLMWDIKEDKLKRKGWQLMPANLRNLYVAVWGELPFMAGGHEG